ncbi:MAG: carboxylating nicotinate-nucleotide diphosphorylase [Pirellulales bacterium]
MPTEFNQLNWDEMLADDCRQLVRLAVREDLERGHDVTTVAIVAAGRRGRAAIVAREAGVVCGLRAAETVIDEMDADIELSPQLADGDAVAPEQVVAELAGSARDLLTCERTILNFMGRLSGIATLTREYVQRAAQISASETQPLVRIYDTRKTTPGWRRLEKFAVHCGGGWNHRTGLFDAVLIKDNHLALASEAKLSPAAAVELVRENLRKMLPDTAAEMVIEVEVDSLAQLHVVLSVAPDVVLLDNMPPATLREAVALRAAIAPSVVLEASGGVNLQTIAAIAATGVDRISVGALTHSARTLDLGIDWQVD